MSVVDHIIIAVEDLEKASQDYALMLGRAPSWRGTHPDYGSANTCFVSIIAIWNCSPPMVKVGPVT